MAQNITAEDAKAFLAKPAFNRSFELPASPADGRDQPLKFTYVDFGHHHDSPDADNVVLFIPPLMSSRMLHVAKDDLAKRHKVRCISMDRPGFGGSDDVDINKRLEVSRAAILELLKQLNIKHVAVACQSAGTIYALDLIYHHPEILHPDRPYLAIGAPWVHSKHSGNWAMAISHKLPPNVLGHFDKVVNAFQTVAGPASGVSSSILHYFSELTPQTRELPLDQEAAFDEALMGYIHSQKINGISDELILLMQKIEGNPGFGTWGDYDALAPKLADVLEAKGLRLTMDVYFAETDRLIGNPGSAGPTYFEECWKKQRENWPIDCTFSVVEGADHDGIWRLVWHTASTTFKKIGVDPEAPSS